MLRPGSYQRLIWYVFVLVVKWNRFVLLASGYITLFDSIKCGAAPSYGWERFGSCHWTRRSLRQVSELCMKLLWPRLRYDVPIAVVYISGRLWRWLFNTVLINVTRRFFLYLEWVVGGAAHALSWALLALVLHKAHSLQHDSIAHSQKPLIRACPSLQALYCGVGLFSCLRGVCRRTIDIYLTVP